MRATLFAGAVALALSGCQVASDRDNRIAAATIVGAGAGILLASELYGTSTGGAIAMLGFGTLGAAGGYWLAQSLLPEEKQAMSEAAYRSLEQTPVGKTVRWQDADTGNSGSFTPLRAYVDKQGRRCRDLQSTVSVGAETRTSQSSVCRISDTAWQVADRSGS
jgi:surface antigen